MHCGRTAWQAYLLLPKPNIAGLPDMLVVKNIPGGMPPNPLLSPLRPPPLAPSDANLKCILQTHQQMTTRLEQLQCALHREVVACQELQGRELHAKMMELVKNSAVTIWHESGAEQHSHVHEESEGILHVLRKELIIVIRVRLRCRELLISCIHLLELYFGALRVIWILVWVPVMQHSAVSRYLPTYTAPLSSLQTDGAPFEGQGLVSLLYCILLGIRLHTLSS